MEQTSVPPTNKKHQTDEESLTSKMKRTQRDCPTCGESDSWLNLETGWINCYKGHSKKIQEGTGTSDIPEGIEPPPFSEPPSPFIRGHLRKRLQLKRNETLKLPAAVRETKSGILFHFAGSDYWQVRVWEELRYLGGDRKWICPPGPFSEPYVAFQNPFGTAFDVAPEHRSGATSGSGDAQEPNVEKEESQVLYLCEGILDALCLYNIGLDSLAVLTTLPRIGQISKYQSIFDEVVWVPDGDVSASQIRKGKGLLQLLWEEVTVVNLPRTEDPASMKRTKLKSLLRRHTA